MGRRPVENKKTPSDYPQISFRVSNDDKVYILRCIESLQTALNKRRKESEPYINKNDIFLRALKEGLKRIK